MVDADIFHSTYMPTRARPHEYRKLGRILAKCMDTAFAVSVRGSIEQGHAGDYLVQTEQGDQWVVEGQFFSGLYAPDVAANAGIAAASGKSAVTPGEVAVTLAGSSRRSEGGTPMPVQRVRPTVSQNNPQSLSAVPIASASPPIAAGTAPPTPTRKAAPSQQQRASTAAAGLASMRGGDGLVSIRRGSMPASRSLFEVQRQMINKNSL
jgi:pyruvate/2-oxoglutarate dehydrogenase complex dihydrolipoamide acyltransferase (E2) component